MMKHAKKYIIIAASVIAILLVGLLLYNLFYNINNLPDGEVISETTSSNGEYTLKTYISVSSLSADAIRVELIDNNNNKVKNIYWGYKFSEASIEWIDNDTVVINGKKLDLPHDTYDWRRE